MGHTYVDMSLFLLLVTALIFFLLLFILILLFLHRRKQLRHNELLSAVRSMHEQQLLGLQLAAQEETFAYLARELHDHINLSLTLLKLNLHGFRDRLSEDDQAALESSLLALEQVSHQVSQLARSWNTDVLQSRGFLSALQTEVERIEQLRLFRLDFCVEGEPVHLDSQKEIIALRLIQEAFNNILKHAGAQCVKLAVIFSPVGLEIDINDDGKGFLMNQMNNDFYRKSGKSGLRNLQTRAKLIGGFMRLDSCPGHGTRLFFSIPI